MAAKSKNERNTENVIRDQLRELGYYNADNDIQVEEQKSNIEAVKKALKSASKTGKGGSGAPEFIISAPSTPDFLVIFEGKADTKDHVSSELQGILDGTLPVEPEEDTERLKAVQRANRYAADGALHYARFLSKEYNVIAVAVSGETARGAKISTYLWPRGAERPKLLTNQSGQPVESIIPWADYVAHGSFDPSVQKLRFDQLMTFAKDLHEFMRDHAKLTESEKPLLVSGTLLALQSRPFAAAYNEYPAAELQKAWMTTIKAEIEKADIPNTKKDNMTQPYSSIEVHPELGKSTKDYPRGVLNELIRRLDEKVKPFITIYHDYDVVGQFYGEFLRYTGGDKKGLGIVLTPRHITELFALLANVTKKSTVLDTCTGSGAFLIASMHQMMKGATTEAERKRIKSKGLIGIEQQPNMFALAASNMILRGDGKANLHQGSCFDDGIISAVKELKPDVGMINPPYSQSDASLHELRFIQQMLDALEEGGTGLAIVPISCAIAPHPLKAELMRDHTLEAVMSMPSDLFYPVGTVTCIMVWTAHKPHAESDRATWFGYWKDDGHIKVKNLGRTDVRGEWPSIRDRWVKAYRNRTVHAGESVMKEVGPDDEWCAEAYMETDYSTIAPADFEKVVRDYAVFRLLGAQDDDGEEAAGDAE
jgi:type I restriction enzyme M protein